MTLGMPCLGYGDGDGREIHADGARLSLHDQREGHGGAPAGYFLNTAESLIPPGKSFRQSRRRNTGESEDGADWRRSERPRHHFERSPASLRICAALENPRRSASSCGVVKSSILVLAVGSAPRESNSSIIRRSF